jgi:hypothetical protein
MNKDRGHLTSFREDYSDDSRDCQGNRTGELGKGNEIGAITRDESSDYGTGIYMVAAGGEVEKSNWDRELPKGGILMSTTVHISDHVVDEHTKGSDDGEQIPGNMLHSHDIEKGLGLAR